MLPDRSLDDCDDAMRDGLALLRGMHAGDVEAIGAVLENLSFPELTCFHLASLLTGYMVARGEPADRLDRLQRALGLLRDDPVIPVPPLR